MYTPVPIRGAKIEGVKEYYEALIDADTLKFRYSDTVSPGWKDVLECYMTIGDSMYLVTDDNNNVVGEFTLADFKGKAAQIHFSAHPELSFTETLNMMREVPETILNKWKDDDGLPFLYSLVGLTPVSNRAACIAVLKAGYKKLGVIPKACFIARHSFYDDAMISIREVN